MNRLVSNPGKKWFLVLCLFTLLFLTSQFFTKQTNAQTATAVIATGQLNVRSGPSIEYGVVTTLNQGAVVTLLGRNADSSWAYIQTVATVRGWVNASPTYITPSVAINTLDVVTPATPTPTTTATAVSSSTPAPSPTPTATATTVSGAAATVATGALNVRSGPSLAYSAVAVVYQGNVVSLIGRNADATWAKIRLNNGTEGWVNAASTYITPNVSVTQPTAGRFRDRAH